MVCAGLVAPAQLFALVALNRVLLFWHLALVLFDATVIVWSYHTWRSDDSIAEFDPRCPGVQGAVVTLKHQMLWVCIHCGLHWVMMLIRIKAEYTVRTTYVRIKNRKVAHQHAWAGSLGVLLQSDIDNPRALYLFDTLTNSGLFQFASVLLIADFIWNIIGVGTFFTDRAKCSEGAAIQVSMQMYGMLFALFFLANVIFMIVFIAYKMAMRPGRVATVLRNARNFDSTVMLGMPALSLFLRVFFFRDVSDRQQVEEQCLLHEAKAVEDEEAKLLAQVEALRKEKEHLQAARMKLGKAGKASTDAEEKFAEEWLKNLEQTFQADGKDHSLSAIFQHVREDVVGHRAARERVHELRPPRRIAIT
jgi:hypothetical protein